MGDVIMYADREHELKYRKLRVLEPLKASEEKFTMRPNLAVRMCLMAWCDRFQ